MSREPNPEQKLAISQRGNACLFAGAGAGKTFVITEHVFEVLSEIVIEVQRSQASYEEFNKELRKRFSKIVVMTFTKKAAREIKQRIKIKFEEASVKQFDEKIAESIQSSLSAVFVGTIHSFFFKVIREFSLEADDTDVELISAFKIKEFIKKLILERFDIYSENPHFLEIVSNPSTLANSLYALKGNPVALELWKNNEAPYKATFEDFVSALPIDLKQISFELGSFGEEKEKKWHSHYRKIDELIKKLDSVESLRDLLIYINETRAANPTSREPEAKEFFVNEIAAQTALGKFAKKVLPFINYSIDRPEDIQFWQNLYRELILEIEKKLESYELFDFSDIELKLAQILNNSESKKLINEAFDYIIIDEYQDTSLIQFDIIKEIINEDFNKLYVVGDPKQSIYGFRGGEVQVFFQTSQLLKEQVKMQYNYRSTSAVIDFNNRVFEILLGDLAKNTELNVAQKHGNKELPPGHIYHLDIEDDQLEPKEINEQKKDIEKSLLLDHLINLNENNPDDDIAVLVRKTKHSILLATELMKRDIGVSFQFKIRDKDCALILLLQNLLEIYLMKDDDNSIFARIQKEFNLLGMQNKIDHSFARRVKSEINLYGVINTLKKFVSENQLSITYFAEQVDLINTLIESKEGHLEQLWSQLSYQVGEGVTVVLENMEKPKLFFMTVHSSKGLEFDHVVLAGLYESQQKQGDGNVFGSSPLDFSFKDGETGETIQTIGFLKSKMEKDEREKSESKRLFYVACTRAIKSLSFVYLTNAKMSEGAWANDLGNSMVQISELCEDVKLPYKQISSQKLEGNTNRIFNFVESNNIKKTSQTYIFPEVSVSKLSDLVVCPKLFYLKNVIRLTPDFSVNASETAVSSAERGTEIHAKLENYILSGELKSSDEGVHWTKEKIDLLKSHYELVPEKEVKFKVENQMISGTIDLVALNENEIKIIDYKTGRYEDMSNSKYFFQVLLYAKSICDIEPSKSKITLEIWYLDQKMQKNYELERSDIENVIQFYWSKMLDYSVENKSHCAKCFLSKVCL